MLDKTDAAIKSELESLLPLQVWAELRSEAASLAATARDDGARLAGETGAAERAAATAAAQMAAVRALTLTPTPTPTRYERWPMPVAWACSASKVSNTALKMLAPWQPSTDAVASHRPVH